MKFTSAASTAMAILLAKGVPASSLLLLGGPPSLAEEEATTMFVESLRRTELVKACASSPAPFAGVGSNKNRPLIVVIPWGDPTTSAEDHELVRELGLHLAGAFFRRLQ